MRGETIKYSSYKKKSDPKRENEIEKYIQKMEKIIYNDYFNLDENISRQLETKKNELEDIRRSMIEGVLIRSRRRNENLDEKPTQYFFN